jgi:hypothetical protein
MKIESNKTNKSKLAVALQRRFGTAKNLLRALGLDESLADNTAERDVDGTKARMAEFRTKLESWLSEHAKTLPEQDSSVIGKILAIFDQPVGGEDEVDNLEAFRKLLREKYRMSESDIAVAISLAKGEAAEATDYLPANGLPSSGGFGGRISGARAQHGMDERRRVGFDEMYGADAKRIGLGTDYGTLRRPRPAPAASASAAAVKSFEELYGADGGRFA